MIKISLKTLICLLEDSGHRFIIERCQGFTDKLVLKLLVANSYPVNPSLIIGGSLEDKKIIHEERIGTQKVKTLCHYDCSNDTLISMCMDLQKIIKTAQERLSDDGNQNKELLLLPLG